MSSQGADGATALPSTPGEVETLLGQPRAQGLEFLEPQVSPLRLAQHLAAMANGDGGLLLLGVGHDRSPAGADDEGPLRELARTAAGLADPPLILPLPRTARTARGLVLLVQVPPGLPHVYGVQGRYLVRQGARNAPLDSRGLRRLWAERCAADAESTPLPQATLDDLDWPRVEAYLQQAAELGPTTPQEALLLRGCLVEQEGVLHPTLAGMLLFGKQPQRFVPASEIIAVRYPGTGMGDAFIREDVHGPLPEQIQRAEGFLVSQMRRGVRLRDLQRAEQGEYPRQVLREVLVNAVAHRDYGIRGEGIRILMYADRVECYSPGRLPGHVTVENLVQERFSRNPVIVQVLADMGFIERLGYGIDRMIAQMESLALPPPAFRETANGFVVTLFGPGQELLTLSAPPAQWAGLSLNPRQEAALEFVARQGRITNREYRDLQPEISDETARRDLADLVDQGLLLKIGEK
ncbi:MAG: DeoR family transcriptional regulator, partial [Chloroflexi bacterium]|nr:DeoR family transcriptional regulator [Chloroflexota bacterium]